MMMSRKLLLKCRLSLALFGMSFLNLAFAQAGGGAMINEVPHGAIDGWNTTFTVSEIPLDASTDHLYRNGVPLVYQTDYRVNSNVITIAPSQVPQVGDSLYFSYLAATGSPRSISPISAPVAPAQNRDEVSIAASREALRNEASKLSSAMGGDTRERGLQLFHRSDLERQHELEALTMLSSRLTDGQAGIADGLEGLGDAPAPSVYSARAETSSRGRPMLSASERLESQPSSGRTVAPPLEVDSDPAIRLLERQLSVIDPQQLGNIDATPETMSPSVMPSDASHQPALSASRELRMLRRTSREAIDILGTRLGIAGVSEIAK